MATPAQIEANRRNAQHSTGPRTPQGKLRSSRNATTLGLFTARLLLPGEDPAELDALRDGILRRLDPADALEAVYAARVVVAAWRLRRAFSGEAAVYARWKSQRMTTAEALATQYPMEDLERLQKHIAVLERSMDRALAEIHKLRKFRPDPGDGDGDGDGDSGRDGDSDGERADDNKPAAADAPDQRRCEIEPNPDDPSTARQDEPTPKPPAATTPAATAIAATAIAASARVEIVKTNPIPPPPTEAPRPVGPASPISKTNPIEPARASEAGPQGTSPGASGSFGRA